MSIIRFIEERPSKIAGRLGRHIEHDPRSRAYAFDHSGITLKTVRHERKIPILDQGSSLGSCTGNAACGALGTEPFYDTISGITLNEDAAVKFYSFATHMDNIAGIYPPTDTGSTGVAVAKAVQKLGLISGYQHTFSINAFLAALVITPVIIGINWYESFDKPDADGTIKIAGSVRGGHELVVTEIDAEKSRVGIDNSWSESYGIKGRVYASFDTMGQLLSEQGDATVFIPNTQPAPAPTPVPQPKATPEDLALWVEMKKWALAKGIN